MSETEKEAALLPVRSNAGLDGEPVYMKCPFCGGEDYDLIGLKIHFLNGWCDEFNDLETKSRGGG